MSTLARKCRAVGYLTALALAAMTGAGCDGSLPDDSQFTQQFPPSVTADAGPVGQKSSGLTCKPVDTVHGEQLPARGSAIRRITTAQQTVIPTGDLFEQFRSHCGGCHVDAGQGKFQVNRQNFAANLKQLALDRIRSADRVLAMPPPGSTGKLFSERAAGDPLVEFSGLLEAWLKQGKPADGFTAAQKPRSEASPYQLTTDVAMGMTNLGSCIPSKTGFASEKTRSAQLDAKFAAMSQLPERLEETDLFTLDSEVLASHGVVAFAPGYPLWSDGAKKIRMIRVPRGEKIKFDKEKQTFSFPPNTRFYKTFLKKVIDRDGNERYRKVETRLIVARPDDEDPELAGTARHTALFGTYAWNEQETEAVLVRDPLRNGKPFRDRVITLVLNEQKVEEYTRQGITDLAKAQFIESMDAGVADAGAGDHADAGAPPALTRTYAIPGSERCIHCHMGSPSHNFSLGFLPVQLKRRKLGEGGVIDDTGADELTQLQRFLDYGLIEGMKSADEVLPLEESQGTRKPRNDYELEAQGYLLGNCAHCHNPRGFPTSAAPELTDLLNFMPDSDKGGGIFQFPLDRVSPRIKRGPDQDRDIPYITPSLLDVNSGYVPASFPKVESCGTTLVLPDKLGAAPVEKERITPLPAPWRSLIYRNIDTPFSYADDSTIFPHMPRDTAGYDCRSRLILGRWMVSIPAKLRKLEWPLEVPKLAIELPVNDVDSDSHPERVQYPEAYLSIAQPYEEADPNDPDFFRYEIAADDRVREFVRGDRLLTCPDSSFFDVVDPQVVAGTRTFPGPEPNHTNVRQCTVRGGLVPERAHWFVTDLTEAVGDWEPRRADWEDRLRKGHVEEVPTVAQGQDLIAETARSLNDRRTLYLLTGKDPFGRRSQGPDLRITEALRQFSLSDAPLGVWTKSSCVPNGSKPASAYSATEHPWLHDVAADAPVYTMAPGAQVFGTICANCHGPLGDSRGRMADTIADLTGGATRVANLRDGLFGAAGANRARIFGAAAQADGVAVDDWAGRYLLWMGMGGTLRPIPPAVLTVVANSKVLGKQRTGFSGVDWAKVGANMLAVAEQLCQAVLPVSGQEKGEIINVATNSPSNPAPLKDTNGDRETWQRLCTLNNPAPIRVLVYAEPESEPKRRFELMRRLQSNITYDEKVLAPDDQITTTGLPIASSLQTVFLKRSTYPDNAPVGDHLGRIQPRLSEENLAPWCILPRLRADAEKGLSDAEFAPIAADWTERGRKFYLAERKAAGLPPSEPPYCPQKIVEAAQRISLLAGDEPSRLDVRDMSDWIRRGAMNAGLSVFLYLDALAKGEIQRAPEFDVCPRTQ